MGNAWVFPSISHSMGKCNKPHRIVRTWEIGNHTFPIVRALFSYFILILWYTSLMGTAWVSPSISHSTGKCNKTHSMGKTWEIGNQTFPIVWVLFSNLFPSYGILHQMGNAWVFPSISHSTRKCNKTHCMGRTWELGTLTFPIV